MSKNLFELLNSKTKQELPTEISERFLKRFPIKSSPVRFNLKVVLPALFSIVFIFIIVLNYNETETTETQLVQNIELLEEYEILSFLEENELTIEEMELLLEEDIDDNRSS
jgi:hypothetical protein